MLTTMMKHSLDDLVIKRLQGFGPFFLCQIQQIFILIQRLPNVAVDHSKTQKQGFNALGITLRVV